MNEIEYLKREIELLKQLVQAKDALIAHLCMQKPQVLSSPWNDSSTQWTSPKGYTLTGTSSFEGVPRKVK